MGVLSIYNGIPIACVKLENRKFNDSEFQSDSDQMSLSKGLKVCKGNLATVNSYV